MQGVDEPLEEETPASSGQNLLLQCPAKQNTVSWAEVKSGSATATDDWERNVGPHFILQAKNNVMYQCAIYDFGKGKWNVYKIFKVKILSRMA